VGPQFLNQICKLGKGTWFRFCGGEAPLQDLHPGLLSGFLRTKKVALDPKSPATYTGSLYECDDIAGVSSVLNCFTFFSLVKPDSWADNWVPSCPYMWGHKHDFLGHP
jgi:hypothetical protein